MTDYLNLMVEVAVTVYVFLLGLPLLVNQIFLPEDLRRFSQKNYSGNVLWHLVSLTFLLIFIVLIAYAGLEVDAQAERRAKIYPIIVTGLFLIMLMQTLWFLVFQIFRSQGNRAKIVGLIKNKIIQHYQKTGQLENQFVNDLESLGIYSKAGGEIQYIIEASNDILQTIQNQPITHFSSQHINKLIDLLCNSVASSVEPGSRRNLENVLTDYKAIVMWLEEQPPEITSEYLDDIAPKLQKCTTKIAFVALQKNYTDLMPRVLNVITLLSRPSEKLFDIGVKALERDQFLIATNVLSELLDIDNKDKFTLANFMGLIAHFYDAGDTAKMHARRSLQQYPHALKARDLQQIISYHYSSAHFKTVDKLNILKKEIHTILSSSSAE